jgi:hypothetical protein
MEGSQEIRSPINEEEKGPAVEREPAEEES